MGELLALRQQQLPVKVIVFKNDVLALVELEMKAAGMLDFGTDLLNPDFSKIAEGRGRFGIEGGTTGAGSTNDCRGAPARWYRAGRSDRTASGTLDADDDHIRLGERLRPVHAESGVERTQW